MRKLESHRDGVSYIILHSFKLANLRSEPQSICHQNPAFLEKKVMAAKTTFFKVRIWSEDVTKAVNFQEQKDRLYDTLF
jgi:hypothetical protein